MDLKYDRQTRIPNWDQDKINDAKVAVIGAGALGNHVCLGLIGLGIGTIKIFDFDTIEVHNLNRQSLFCESDINQNKAETLAHHLEERNSSSMIIGIDEKIDEENIESVIHDIDLIIDCVDRISVRKFLNNYCISSNIPLIHGGISWCGGQVGILSRKTPCINCIFPESIQKAELNSETSCIHKPEPSVVYISQIIAGIMVEHVRRVILPLPIDIQPPSFLQKIDFRLKNPFYFENIQRKSNCYCVSLLKKIDPQILEEEKKSLSKKKAENNQAIQQALKNGIKMD